jgi:hypothetical protein
MALGQIVNEGGEKRGEEESSKLQKRSLNPPDRAGRLDVATEGTHGIM